MKNKNVPEDRYICKYCYQCKCLENSMGYAICKADIPDLVRVNSPACWEFDYDDTFVRM